MVVALLATALFLLSPAGLRLLTPTLERHLARALNASVDLDGLVLRWPLELQLAHARVYDADTTYLDVRNAALRLDARPLLRRTVLIREFRAARIAYNGLPDSVSEQPRERTPTTPGLPDLTWPGAKLTIGLLEVDELVVGDRVAPHPSAWRVDGSYTPMSALTGRAVRLNAESIEPEGMSVSLTGQLNRPVASTSPGHSDTWLVIARLHATGWSPLVPDWPGALEDRLEVHVDLALKGANLFELQTLRVHSALVDIEGTAHWDMAAPHLHAHFDATVPDIASLAAWVDAGLAGEVTGSLTLDGAPTAPAATVRLASAAFSVNEVNVTELDADFEADSVAAMAGGRVRAAAVVNRIPMDISASYTYEPSRLVLDNLRANVLNALLLGDADIDLTERTVRGEIHLETESVTELAAYWDVEAAGRVEAEARFDSENGMQHVAVNAVAGNVVVPQGALGSLRIEAELRDVLNRIHGSAGIEVRDLAAGDLQVHRVRFEAQGDTDTVEAVVTGSGEFLHPWTFESATTLQFADQLLNEVLVQTLQLEHGEFAVMLQEPARLGRGADGYRVDRLTVQIGGGRLAAKGYARADRIELTATVEDIPLSLFGFAGVRDASGEMDGQFRLAGHPSNPSAELTLQFSGLMPANTNFWFGPPASFSVTAWLEERTLSSRFLLEGLTGRPASLDIEIPLHVSLYPLHVAWPPEGDVKGRLTAETDLGELATLFVLDVHRLGGSLSVDLELSGTVADPDLSGHVRIDNGSYEHEQWGTTLRNVDMLLSGRRDRLAIERFTATDGDRGTLKLEGILHFKPEEQYPFETSLSLDGFSLLRYDTARATGRGAISWAGHRDASEVAGQLTIASMELRIPERLPAALIDLDVIEINGDEKEDTALDDMVDGWSRHFISLDVEILFPDRTFVRGRGLDSEWSGRIRVTGPVEHPEIIGSLSILRGRFVFFGKRLGISRGQVTLDGSFPPTPFLDVVAESRAAGITAIMRLSGDLDAPEIQLDSIPSMPEDEILARLLFGREAARISPIQAITLAQAVNRLRGGGSTFDIMGETRRMLRVDQIEVRASEEYEGETMVSVGKYVGDRVYVELERGVGLGGSRARVEFELTPTIRIESEMGTDAEAGLDVIWTWDY